MSIHPSLAAPDKSSKARTVLKRSERLKMMMEKNQWKEGDDVYRLPKIKTVHIKIKKEKAEKAETAAVPGVVPGVVPGAAPAASPAAPAKGQAAKTQDKK
jgi:small basic protein (TIGR04137 family)